MRPDLDCLVIGYYEPPFEEYEAAIRRFGERSVAYRDLRFSFVSVDEHELNYVDLLNHVYERGHGIPESGRRETFLSGDIPNLAAVYLCSFLRRRELSADYINLFAYERDRLIECLAKKPLCVAITTTFYVLSAPVIDIVNCIRRHDPTVKIVVGGPLIANYFRQRQNDTLTIRGSKMANQDSLRSALEDIGADVYVNESQGEFTLTQIVMALKNGTPLAQVANIAYWDGGELRITRAEHENNLLDDNLIDWSGLDDGRIGATVQTRTARSCAFNCAFCNYPTRAGKLALASIAAVERELDSIRALGTVKNVVFIDDTFNVPLNRFKEICRLMIDRRYEFNWFSYLRCSNVDDEAIALAAESGCKGVFLGIESGSPQILKNMNKAATIEKYAHGIAKLREHRILTFASFIVGFPGETWETVEETIAFIQRHLPDYYRAQVWYSEPGTPIDRERARYGIEGHGFLWRHATMDSTTAMSHIEEMFLRVKASQWLPQWSFDFWIIPYLLGRGITLDQFREFMVGANALLRLEFSGKTGDGKRARQHEQLASLAESVKKWTAVDGRRHDDVALLAR
jgi:radical SAM PhpK family P-methyltransferase